VKTVVILARKPGFLAKAVALLAAAFLLVLAFIFSLIFFAALVAIGLLILVYVWWVTRKARIDKRFVRVEIGRNKHDA